MKRWRRTLSPIIVMAMVKNSISISASPQGFREVQPDGALTPTLYVEGDESYHYTRDEKGYTVIEDEHGCLTYAIKNETTGLIEPSAFRVDQVNPWEVGLSRGIQPRRDIKVRIKEKFHQETCTGKDCNRLLVQKRSLQAEGRLQNLVLLMRFKDHRERKLPSKGDFYKLMNKSGGHDTLAPTGSVKDVYKQSSQGKLIVESTIYGWVDLEEEESHYADGKSGLTNRFFDAIHEALDKLDDDRKFRFRNFDKNRDGEIDAITLVHSGYGAEWGGNDCEGQRQNNRIWSHQRPRMARKWCGKEKVCVNQYMVSPGLWGKCGSKISRIGVFAHELGHFLGLQDMYDGNGGGRGIGSYGLMGNCWGFDGSQLHPPVLDPWSRIKLGWITPVLPTKSGDYSLGGTLDSGTVYKITNGFPSGEYLLIENRRPKGFDAKIPQSGLAIWHIDEKADDLTEGHPGQEGWPRNGKHYRISLVQGDGLYNLEKGVGQGDAQDVYHKSGASYLGPSRKVDTGPFPNTDSYQGGNLKKTGVVISDISAPGRVMSFRLTLPNSPIPRPAPTKKPTRKPTLAPTKKPTRKPTFAPTLYPTWSPTKFPTSSPTWSPTKFPTLYPTFSPTRMPSQYPTLSPTKEPTRSPTWSPTGKPTSYPSIIPTNHPTGSPSYLPTIYPTNNPSLLPSLLPTTHPSSPPSSYPSTYPSIYPTLNPSSSPSSRPSQVPSTTPTLAPSVGPTGHPTQQPSITASSAPSHAPSDIPSSTPAALPSLDPSVEPTCGPSVQPTQNPTRQPSKSPTSLPSSIPSFFPSQVPTVLPSRLPSLLPSGLPSFLPSAVPSLFPSVHPSTSPSSGPSIHPSSAPTRGNATMATGASTGSLTLLDECTENIANSTIAKITDPLDSIESDKRDDNKASSVIISVLAACSIGLIALLTAFFVMIGRKRRSNIGMFASLSKDQVNAHTNSVSTNNSVSSNSTSMVAQASIPISNSTHWTSLPESSAPGWTTNAEVSTSNSDGDMTPRQEGVGIKIVYSKKSSATTNSGDSTDMQTSVEDYSSASSTPRENHLAIPIVGTATESLENEEDRERKWWLDQLIDYVASWAIE